MKHYVKNSTILVSLLTITISCQQKGPKPISLGKDQCDYCKMVISSNEFAAELVTRNGKVYKFDDRHCLHEFIDNNGNIANDGQTYVCDFKSKELIPEKEAWIVSGGRIKSPMGGNSIVSKTKKEAQQLAEKYDATIQQKPIK